MSRPFLKPKHYQYVLWSMAICLVLIGVLSVFFSFRVPPSKPEATYELRGLGLWSLLFAGTVVAIERATTEFMVPKK